MSDTGTTSATWKGTVDGSLPKNQRNKLLVEAEAYGLTLNDLAATCDEFRVSPRNLLNELSIAVADHQRRRWLIISHQSRKYRRSLNHHNFLDI